MFDLYRPFMGATPLKTAIETPKWRQGEVELPAVDITAARATDGTVHLALVNLDPVRPARVATNLKTGKPVQGQILTAAAMDVHNTFEQPRKLVPAAYVTQSGESGLTLELPPKSIVVVEVPEL